MRGLSTLRFSLRSAPRTCTQGASQSEDTYLCANLRRRIIGSCRSVSGSIATPLNRMPAFSRLRRRNHNPRYPSRTGSISCWSVGHRHEGTLLAQCEHGRFMGFCPKVLAVHLRVDQTRPIRSRCPMSIFLFRWLLLCPVAACVGCRRTPVVRCQECEVGYGQRFGISQVLLAT